MTCEVPAVESNVPCQHAALKGKKKKPRVDQRGSDRAAWSVGLHYTAARGEKNAPVITSEETQPAFML